MVESRFTWFGHVWSGEDIRVLVKRVDQMEGCLIVEAGGRDAHGFVI